MAAPKFTTETRRSQRGQENAARSTLPLRVLCDSVVLFQIVAGRRERSKSQIASRIIPANVVAESSQHFVPRRKAIDVEMPTITNVGKKMAWQTARCSERCPHRAIRPQSQPRI